MKKQVLKKPLVEKPPVKPHLLRLVALALALALCAPLGAAERSCHLRLVHAAPDLPALTFAASTVGGAGGSASSRSAPVDLSRELTYGTATGYLAVTPGRYEVRVSAGDGEAGREELRRLTLGCDGDGYYTLVAFGLDPRRADREPSISGRLRRVLGGVEARRDRGESLQVEVMRDHLGRQRGESYLRLFHAAPGVVAVDGEVEARGRAAGVAHAVPYAGHGEVRRLTPGPHTLELRYHGARAPVLVRDLDLAPGRLHTLILVGTPGVPGRPLDVLVLTNPLRVELVEPLRAPF